MQGAADYFVWDQSRGRVASIFSDCLPIETEKETRNSVFRGDPAENIIIMLALVRSGGSEHTHHNDSTPRTMTANGGSPLFLSNKMYANRRMNLVIRAATAMTVDLSCSVLHL